MIETSHQRSRARTIGYILAWAGALLIALYFRLYPLRAFTPQADEQKAALYVVSQVRQRLHAQIDKQYPNLSDRQRDVLTEKKFDEVMRAERDQVRRTIQQVSERVSGQSGRSQGTPYLLASDSFYHFDLTKNIVETGNISDTFRGSKYLNKRMLAPAGYWEPITLHPFVGYGVYRALKWFDADTGLMHAVGFTPLVLTTLALVLFVAACRQLGCGPLPSFVGAVFFALAPIYVKRSTYGWYDNDPYNALFPLLIIISMFAAFNRLDSSRKAIAFGVLTTLIFLLYSVFWQGWVFMFTIALAATAAAFLYNLCVLRSGDYSRNILFFLAAVFGGVFLGTAFVFGHDQFFVLYREGWTALTNFLIPQLSVWPDLYISVSELHRATPHFIILMCGGTFFFSTALVGAFVALVKPVLRPEGYNPFHTVFLTVLLAATVTISFGAQRFTMLCVVPLGLLFTVGIKEVFTSFKALVLKSLPGPPKFEQGVGVVLTIALFSLTFLPIRSITRSLPALLNPIYNDTWDKTLTTVREKTPEDAIINAWWPPGHFIKATSRRRVTFDGASINVPQAYWMANIFLATGEQEALGLLRMLNTSGNQAARFLVNAGLKTSTAVKIIKLVTKLDARQAKLLLPAMLKDQEAAGGLLALTHGAPPPTYVLVYNEFVESNLQLNFIGGWNFERIETINKNPDLLKEVPPRNSPEYVNFLWKLSGGPYKYSGPLAELNRTGDVVTFEQGVTIDLKTKDVNIDSPTYGTGVPLSLFHARDGAVEEKKFNNPTLGYSVLLFEQRQKLHAVLLDRPLARSFLMQLYYFDGAGYAFVKPLTEGSDLTGQTVIKVFEIDWEAYLKEEHSQKTGQ